MSWQALTWACNQELPTAEKMVLIMLSNRCNADTGRCDPSHKRLAKDCGMSRSTLKRHLSKLEEKGFLIIHSRSVQGVSLPNQYTINLGAGSNEIFPDGWVQSESGEGFKMDPPPVDMDRGYTEIEPTVGSNRAEGWVQNGLQNKNIKQEVKQENKQTTGAEQKSTAPVDNSKVKGGLAGEGDVAIFNTQCRDTWEAYRTAYGARYGVEPVSNHKAKQMIQQIVKRLGSQAAPVAGFYVESVTTDVVKQTSHPLEILVKGAEGYHTQLVRSGLRSTVTPSVFRGAD